MKLTENFSLEEFTDLQTAARKGLNNVPAEGTTARKNLLRTAETMEKVREILGHPVLVSSGYRSPSVNAAVGGSKNSAHQYGLAVDFTCPGFGSPIDVCKKLELSMIELQIDQLIHEYKTWVHLGLVGEKYDARHQKLTIDKKGVREGF